MAVRESEDLLVHPSDNRLEPQRASQHIYHANANIVGLSAFARADFLSTVLMPQNFLLNLIFDLNYGSTFSIDY